MSLQSGIEHTILFVTCQCESVSETLARARLWPATPQNPRYAFCFELLDWCEALLLECQVSLKDLCEALYYKCPHLVVKVILYDYYNTCSYPVYIATRCL